MTYEEIEVNLTTLLPSENVMVFRVGNPLIAISCFTSLFDSYFTRNNSQRTSLTEMRTSSTTGIGAANLTETWWSDWSQ